MANIALKKPSGGELILAPEDGTSTETVTIPSVGVGKVLQVVTNTTHSTQTNSLNGYIQVPALDIAFSKIGSNSKVVVTWMINAEIYQDVGFRIYKDGALAPNGRSNVSANNYSTFATAAYDQNEDSTPSNFIIQYIDDAPTTGTYQIFVGSTSGATAQQFALNRTWSSTGAAAREQMVSTVTLMEVAA